MKKIASYIVKASRFLGSRFIIKTINRWLRALISFTHWVQFVIEWGARPHPEWWDHCLYQYWYWKVSGEAYPVERGVFSLLALKPGCRVLELCCGDGFNSHHFYAARASTIYAMDLDPEATRSARANFKNPKVTYVSGDIRTDIPDTPVDNVIWDAAIEHFTEAEIMAIMNKLKTLLGPAGILSGYTIVERDDHRLSHHEHEYEFQSKEDLARILTKFFKHVRIFETIYSSRHNLYFYASNEAVLPFDAAWTAQIVIDQ